MTPGTAFKNQALTWSLPDTASNTRDQPNPKSIHRSLVNIKRWMKCMAQDLAVLLAAANAGDKHLYPLIYPIQLTALLLFLQFGLQHYGVFYLLSHYISVIG